MSIIKNGTVLVGTEFVRTDIEFDKTVTRLGEFPEKDAFDASNCYVLPGLVDIHTHGAVGEDFSDGKPDALAPMAEYYAKNGVTGFLATTMTLGEEELTRAMHAVRDYRGETGAKCLGIHLEGPFLSYEKRGAQAAEHLHKPDIAMLKRLDAASGGRVKMVTVACEEEGAMDFIREASKRFTVSLGHTCADYETAMEAFRAGASHATHLFNGMPSLHHRKPAVIGAAKDAGASVELICDGLHIHPSVVRLTHAIYGEKLNLISDSLRCAGMPDGDYVLGGQPITLSGGVARLKGSDTLAGSCISLLDCVRNAVKFGIPLAQAAYAASTAPAMAAGLRETGVIMAGKAADFIVLDQKLELKAVFIDGVRQ